VRSARTGASGGATSNPTEQERGQGPRTQVWTRFKDELGTWESAQTRSNNPGDTSWPSWVVVIAVQLPEGRAFLVRDSCFFKRERSCSFEQQRPTASRPAEQVGSRQRLDRTPGTLSNRDDQESWSRPVRSCRNVACESSFLSKMKKLE
jgi:hypothetical protein